MVLRSGYRVSKPDGGPACERLERALEAYYSVPYARVFNSCTSALHAALVSTGIKVGDKVLVPAYSMSASASAVLHAGARVVWGDIKRNNYCLSRQYADGISATILVHLFGFHARPETILSIIHDCAQSPSVRPLPSRPQDIWVYSLNQHKVIQCGEGGYALTWKKDIADTLHAVRNHGECSRLDILGWNYRMTEMQAEVALQELEQLDERLERRRLVCRAWWPHSTNVDWFLAPAEDREIPGAARHHGYHLPIYRLPYFREHPELHTGSPCPVVEKLEAKFEWYDPEELIALASLSRHPGLSEPGIAQSVA